MGAVLDFGDPALPEVLAGARRRTQNARLASARREYHIVREFPAGYVDARSGDREECVSAGKTRAVKLVIGVTLVEGLAAVGAA